MTPTILALLLAATPPDGPIHRGWERCQSDPVACEAYLSARLGEPDPRTAELRAVVEKMIGERR